jgi:16S rRNA (guanine527-N7)-methyltransferase
VSAKDAGPYWSEVCGFLAERGVHLDDSSPDGRLCSGLVHLRELLEEKNKVLNLTSIEGEAGFWYRHCADSLSLLALGDLGVVMDWGTGGGFPGIPLALARILSGRGPDVVFVDSVGKKLVAVQEFCSALGLGLGPQSFQWARGEAVLAGAPAGAFDTVVMRAVAPPDRAKHWFSPKAKRWVLMIGPAQRDLWLREESFLRKKGFAFAKALEFALPGGAGQRVLLEVGPS